MWQENIKRSSEFRVVTRLFFSKSTFASDLCVSIILRERIFFVFMTKTHKKKVIIRMMIIIIILGVIHECFSHVVSPKHELVMTLYDLEFLGDVPLSYDES